MAAGCCKSMDELIIDAKLVEWMKNLPAELHDEPITKIAIPGKNKLFTK
jgi:hypothetical protein